MVVLQTSSTTLSPPGNERNERRGLHDSGLQSPQEAHRGVCEPEDEQNTSDSTWLNLEYRAWWDGGVLHAGNPQVKFSFWFYWVRFYLLHRKGSKNVSLVLVASFTQHVLSLKDIFHSVVQKDAFGCIMGNVGSSSFWARPILGIKNHYVLFLCWFLPFLLSIMVLQT